MSADRTQARQLALLVALAAVVGAVAAVAATAFTSLVHGAENVLWTTLPASLGADEPPWWWVLGVLLVGALLVALAVRLPGRGGHHPLDGLSFGAAPRDLLSILLAAFGSLAFGAVVGPEAPLLALGAGIGVLAAGRVGPGPSRVLVLAGAGAAIGVVLGSPLVTALLLLEALLHAPRADDGPGPARAMVPVLVALGTGDLVRVGVGDWPGVHTSTLTTGDLAAYPTVHVADLGWGLVTALATTALVVLATRSAESLRDVARRAPTVALAVAGLAIGGLALAVRATTGVDVDVVLFSGQQSLGTVTATTAVGTLVVVAVVKTVAYALSLGAGFRGGAIFPAVFVGCAVGAAAAAGLPGAAVGAQVACGIAAGAAVVLGMPVTALTLAVLLCTDAGPAVTVPAILGAVVGTVAKTVLDARRDGVDTTDATNTRGTTGATASPPPATSDPSAPTA
ncbi:chloride channel protein [Cellulosimicrobium sp. NPDC057127]|uniref:chloride channel protein n=1 Tax=Cellulosimicrobium sp. NPDC057127 TaxID=3346026 RepID=UPI00362BC08A